MAFLMLFPALRNAPPTAAQALPGETSRRGISGKNVRELIPLLNPRKTGFMFMLPL
jgi:hypothetical protein